MEHMCWMNLGKAAPLLRCLRKITFTISVWDWHGLFISISSKLNKYEIQTLSWQHGIHGSTYCTRFWKRTLLKPNTRLQVHNRPLSEYPNKFWQDRGQYVAAGAHLRHDGTDSPQQPSCSACLWEILWGMSSPGACAVLLAQISARTISKNNTESQCYLQEETVSNTEVW